MRVAGIGAEGEGRSEDDGPRARRGRHRRGVVADYREHAGVAAEIPAEVFPGNRLEGDRVLGPAEPAGLHVAADMSADARQRLVYEHTVLELQGRPIDEAHVEMAPGLRYVPRRRHVRRGRLGRIDGRQVAGTVQVIAGAVPSAVTAVEVQSVVDAVAVVVATAPVSLATWFCPAVHASVSGASAETEIAPSNPQGASAWV